MTLRGIELEKTFSADQFEDRIYSWWKESGWFQPLGDADRDPFVIVIPPPNVTGVLHMGHGLNNSMQDIVIRYQRMRGRPTLWVPGTDHAGIATQNVVEKRVRAEGSSREEMGRDAFIERTWQVKEEHHAIITRQLEKIGASCDWSRERFTLDDGLSAAVREVFVALYERDLIYRGEYLINWCPSCGTALSDDEVEYAPRNGTIWRLRYPIVNAERPDAPEGSAGWIEVATTRPETMLGDTAVAVHPDDERYAGLVGSTVRLPLSGRLVPIIADSYVDREFGSGAVKITPAHDPNDWAIGERHGLDRINILTADARLNENVPAKYRGMDVATARQEVVADLEAGGYLQGSEDHQSQVGRCYRCETVVEPWVSTQWFVRMRPLADRALQAWRDGQIRFFPRHWENTYTHWLETIRDWCVSRQLWWGHRIPVWYDDATGEVIVSRTDPTTDPAYKGRTLRQDPDVLDTWFSSWLWPFSTLGWPEETDDLARFYPTTALVTGYDIIFFWVARMIMAGLTFRDEVPFRDIYITGLVRDAKGRKMSKSLGNGIDPLDIVAQYGADAHKFTLAYLAVQGQDVPISTDSFQLGSKFANKVWNAARYILMNIDGATLVPFAEIDLQRADRWILHRLDAATRVVGRAMEQYRMDDASRAIYEFVWNEFCDWYIEVSKLATSDDDAERRDRGVSLLLYVLEETLRLMHPFMSFVSEEIYRHLPDGLVPMDGSGAIGGVRNTNGRSPALIVARYPEPSDDRAAYEGDAGAFTAVQELVRGIRTLRSELTIARNVRFDVYVRVGDGRDDLATLFVEEAELVGLLAGTNHIEVGTDDSRRTGRVGVVGRGFEAYLDVRSLIDGAAQVTRLAKAIERAEAGLAQAEKKLGNAQFVERAKPEAVAAERAKREDLADQVARMRRLAVDLSE